MRKLSEVTLCSGCTAGSSKGRSPLVVDPSSRMTQANRISSPVVSLMPRAPLAGHIAHIGRRAPVAPWTSVMAAIVREFIGEPTRRLGAPNTTPAQELADQEREIGDAGFADVTTRVLAISHEWTLETLLGHARSTSTLSRAALGARHEDFETALTRALLELDSTGRYREELGCGYTFARKP